MSLHAVGAGALAPAELGPGQPRHHDGLDSPFSLLMDCLPTPQSTLFGPHMLAGGLITFPCDPFLTFDSAEFVELGANRTNSKPSFSADKFWILVPETNLSSFREVKL